MQNVDEYLLSNPQASFMPYMGVFRLSRETTKCRIVFLSNLVEKNSNNNLTVSHNQAILHGPSLNQKLASSILHLRFDKFLLCFDLVKTFNQIGLSELDQSRLLFLWIDNEGKTIVYKNARLTFGLRCSPAILILALFKILVLDSKSDNCKLYNLKKLIYQLTYMDNCAVSSEDCNYISWAYELLNSIFDPYKFEVQQFLTNEPNLSSKINSDDNETVKKLLGINWDQVNDTIFTDKLYLDSNSNTKRKILSTFASNFDIFSFNGPLLNRARLFLHSLQCDQNLEWDQLLSDELLHEWQKIAKQVNQSPPILIKRNVGNRKDTYRLIAFSDSSKLLYGCVIYILNLNTNILSFLMSKSKVINKQLESKSMPQLELQALTLAVECLLDLYFELSGDLCVCPINIESLYVYSDSLVILHWINSFSQKMDKMNKQSVFVQNRLENIDKLCEKHPVTFSFVAGTQNPADVVTRNISPKLLERSNYLTGPSFLVDEPSDTLSKDTLTITVPNPLVKDSYIFSTAVNCKIDDSISYLILLDRYFRN